MVSEISTIGDLLDETGGSIQTGPFGTKLKASEYTPTGVPVISVGEVGYGRLRIHDKTPLVDESVWSRMPVFLLKEGDIVFGRKGAVDRSAQVQQSEHGYFLGSDGIRIRLNPEACESKYIAYQLQTVAHRSWILQHAAGSTMPSLNEGIIRRIPIVLKPFEEQKRIAHILGTHDDKIDLNRRMNRTLEEMAQAIFKSWFVDFEPVKAKAEARAEWEAANPGKKIDSSAEALAKVERAAMATIAGKTEDELAQLPETQQQSLAQTASLFPDSFQDSELGEIPARWQPSKLGDEADLTMGQSPKSEFYNKTGEGLPFHQGVTNYGARFPIHQTFCTMETRLAQAGDLLFSVRAPVGRINIADQRIVIGRGLSALRHKGGLQTFLTYFLKHHFQKEDSIGSGTIFNSVTKKELLDFPCVAPSISLTEIFEARIEALDKQIAVNDKQSRTLAQLRDTLLPKLLSGELTVPEAQSQTEEAVS